MPYVESGWPVVLKASLWLLVWVLSFHGIGAAALGRYLPRHTDSEIWLFKAFSISLGAFLFSVWLFLSGLLGYIGRPALFIFLGIGVVLAIMDKKRHGRRELEAMIKTWAGMKTFERGVLVLILLMAASSFLGAQAPAAGNDDLAYHLYFPKLYVEAGGLVHDPTHERSLWPFFMEMLYTAGLLLQGVALAKLFSWLTAALSVMAVAAAASFFLRRARLTLLAGLFLGAVPAVWQQSLYAYVDNAMMLYTLLSFLALSLLAQRGYRSRDAFIAGLCLAALLSLKIYALVPCALLSLVFGGGFVKNRKFGALAIVCASVAVFAGGWYVRSWLLSGNPVYPFMADIFGGHGFSHRVIGFAEMPKTPLNFILMPWNTAFKVATFGGEPLGALFLAVLPLIFLARGRNSFLNKAAFFSAAYVVVWFFTIQHARFLFPVIPALSLLSAHALDGWMEEWGSAMKRAALFVGALLFVVQAALGFYYSYKILPAALGFVSAETYLKENERTYGWMRKVQSGIASSDQILFVSEPRLFYSPVPAVLMGPVVQKQVEDSGVSFGEWLARQGITHVMAASRTTPQPKPILPEGFVLPGLSERFSGESSAKDDTMYYALYRISA